MEQKEKEKWKQSKRNVTGRKKGFSRLPDNFSFVSTTRTSTLGRPVSFTLQCNMLPPTHQSPVFQTFIITFELSFTATVYTGTRYGYVHQDSAAASTRVHLYINRFRPKHPVIQICVIDLAPTLNKRRLGPAELNVHHPAALAIQPRRRHPITMNPLLLTNVIRP